MTRRRKVLLELPYSAQAPRLTNESLGIHRLTTRSDDTFEMDMTILDAPDHRLLRAGVLLAHRVTDGLGEWYLDAPDWQPWLPRDLAEPMGAAGDLPADLAELVRPFRRRATLGPVAGVQVERRSYTLRDAEGTGLGTLVDERITIRSQGLTMSRFREVVLQPSPAMSGAQRRFLVDSLHSVGGIEVDQFAQLGERLGAPATGLTDFPVPSDWDERANLETFVSQVFVRRLHDILRADLALRASELARRVRDEAAEGAAPSAEPGIGPLLSELQQLRHQLASFATVLEPGWREQVESDLGVVLGQGAARSVATLDERYYAVLDALIGAVRAPQLGDRGHEQAAPVLREQFEAGMGILVGRCQTLRAGDGNTSPDEDWEAAMTAARQLLGTTEGLGILFGKQARKVAKQLRKLQHLLEPTRGLADWPSDAEVAAMSPRDAFERGRALQQAGAARDEARRRFVQEWPALRRKLVAIRKNG